MSYYQKRKAQTIDDAIEWQAITAQKNMSYSECAYWYDYFYNLAKRYGLLKEFRNNGII